MGQGVEPTLTFPDPAAPPPPPPPLPRRASTLRRADDPKETLLHSLLQKPGSYYLIGPCHPPPAPRGPLIPATSTRLRPNQ